MQKAVSSSWSPVGRNPYGETVEENPQGHRRVATEKGWEGEKDVAPWRVCRAVSTEDAKRAMLSLADPWVSEGFEHNARRAYVVYRLSPGQPLSGAPRDWGADGDPRWHAFALGVARAQGDRVLRAWLRRRPLAQDVPKWAGALAAPGGTAVRGVQWGLAHHLEKWQAAHPSAMFLEVGLINAGDAATARLPSSRRQAWSLRPAAIWAPLSQVSADLPPLPGKASAFGKKAAVGWTSALVPITWATRAARAALPGASWEAWWTAVAGQTAGAVIFDCPLPRDAAHLLAALRKVNRPAGRWKIGTQAEVWAWGLGVDHQAVEVTLEQWAAPVDPPFVAQDLTHTEDRVPYRALSQVDEPQGVAGVALEASMHAALKDFSRAHPQVDVDAWVAQGLGVPVETLGTRLSPEQVDAVALARQSLDVGTGFLVSDETGFGKGRILASVALTGLAQGRTVVFVTENPFLFSDFYRDLAAVSPSVPPVPSLLHQTATVVSPEGKTVAKSIKNQDFKEWLKEREWRAGEDRLIFTTYAQLARQHDGLKIGWLKDRLGLNGWVLLDEAHNAAGSSSVADRIGELIKSATGTVFASATFAKHEENLDLYRSVLALPSPAQRLLRLALAGDDGRLREALTQQMARSGRLVRREHPPVPPPVPEWVPITPARAQAIQAFGDSWRGLFEATGAFARLSGVREAIWLQLGAALSRSVKEFGLQIKADALVDLIAAKRQEDKKVVVVVDSTLEAALREALTPDEEGLADSEDLWEDQGAVEDQKEPTRSSRASKAPKMATQGEGAPPLWRDRLRAILEAVCPRAAWENDSSPEAEAARSAFCAAEAAMVALPAWDLAPLDRVRSLLEEKAIRASELSGRKIRLQVSSTGWKIVPRTDPDRNAVVRLFNAGDLDVLFVTRAGCAGISLHAGRQFADQRVRCLIEWDIAANPVSRVQFWGRVRRKDQVVEPEFFGLVLDTPEDRRIMEREDRKRRKMTAHMGARAADQVGWLSGLGESLVEEWATERPRAAFPMGVAYPVPDNPLGRVDRALVRSLVLPEEERQAFLHRLTRGVAVGAEAFALSRQDQASRSSRSVSRVWWWGDPESSTSDPALALSALRLDLVERVWRPTHGADPEHVLAAVRAAHGQEPTAAQVLERWKAAWAEEARRGVAATPYRTGVARWIVARLPGLDVGQALVFTHPESGRPVRAVAMGWWLPEAQEPLQGASPWALTQVGLRVWAVGDAHPLVLSLRHLSLDSAFQAIGSPAQPSWFRAPPVPVRRLAIEGHPVQAAAWGRRWGWGRAALIRDADEGAQVAWLLPATVTMAQMMALPRDLVDVDHARSFWNKFPDQSLTAALPLQQKMVGTPVQGGLRLALDEATLKQTTKTWLHGGLVKKLRLQADAKTPGWVATVVPWKYVPQILHGLAGAGVGWRVPAAYLEWYRETSPLRTRSKTG